MRGGGTNRPAPAPPAAVLRRIYVPRPLPLPITLPPRAREHTSERGPHGDSKLGNCTDGLTPACPRFARAAPVAAAHTDVA